MQKKIPGMHPFAMTSRSDIPFMRIHQKITEEDDDEQEELDEPPENNPLSKVMSKSWYPNIGNINR
jgi:hypothetical protein